ncbi:MAG TPA: Panacea domain-containing protein [Caulobacteraceae bacterium]|nr:Panacea domain-containing protein [Caulobacteraceae bacterium]
MTARYAVNTTKALETILWLASERPGIDIYHVVKGAFYADKYHLNRYGRPIAGDDYIAHQYGPLGDVVYGLLRGDPMEILALGGNGELPFVVEGVFSVRPLREPNMRRLSKSEVEALRVGLEFVADKTFNELVEVSHREAAYLAAGGGRMRYEDLLDPDDPRRREKADYLAETAGSTAL